MCLASKSIAVESDREICIFMLSTLLPLAPYKRHQPPSGFNQFYSPLQVLGAHISIFKGNHFRFAKPLPMNIFRYFKRYFYNSPATAPIPNSLSPSEREARQKQLFINQSLYKYESPSVLPGIAFVRGPVSKLPQELPRLSWLLKVILVAARILLNFVFFLPSTLLSITRLFFEGVFLAVWGEKHAPTVQARYYETASGKMVANALEKKFIDKAEMDQVLRRYKGMWIRFPLPPLANHFMRDDIFARLRVAGFNPMSLYRVSDSNTVGGVMPFPVSERRLGEPLDVLIRERRLYAQDFSFMKQLHRELEQKFAVTSALYVVPKNNKNCLKAVAICVNNAVVYPDAPGNWILAKLALNQNDAVHHEFVAHLGKTHLLVEPFVAATMRQLHPTHPVHRLLRPHFEGTVFINEMAKSGLVAPGKYIDKIFAGEIESLMKWCARRVLNNKFNASMPDEDLKQRGLMEKSLHMPYRDDALAHFEAIVEWVGTYLTVYYRSDADVCGDEELQAWAKELVAENGGRVLDFGEGELGRVVTRSYLIRAVAMLIFSASVQHAAVNFGQLTMMSFAPAVSGALYADMPREGEEAGLEVWKKMLTPLETAVDQMKILGVLGGVYHTRLGMYRRGEIDLEKKQIRDGLNKWRVKLKEIDERIVRREHGNDLPYDLLRPAKIPQSINI